MYKDLFMEGKGFKFFKYRSAMIHWMIKFKLEDEEIDDLWHDLLPRIINPDDLPMNKQHMDNHVVFWCEEAHMGFLYSDRCLYIGTELEVSPW